MCGCLLRNVSAALNPAGPLPMAVKPGATTLPGYHFVAAAVSVVRLWSYFGQQRRPALLGRPVRIGKPGRLVLRGALERRNEAIRSWRRSFRSLGDANGHWYGSICA